MPYMKQNWYEPETLYRVAPEKPAGWCITDPVSESLDIWNPRTHPYWNLVYAQVSATKDSDTVKPPINILGQEVGPERPAIEINN
jgi:hypothetical protein